MLVDLSFYIGYRIKFTWHDCRFAYIQPRLAILVGLEIKTNSITPGYYSMLEDFIIYWLDDGISIIKHAVHTIHLENSGFSRE